MHPILQAILPNRPAPRPVVETEATLAELQQRREAAADVLAVADAALDQALIDQADGKVGHDAVAKAAKAAREAGNDYELATRAVQVATSRVEDSATAEANAAENAAWDRIQALMDERVTAIARLASAIGFFAKAYRETEEINEALYLLSHDAKGRVRLDRDDALLTDGSLYTQVYKEIQRLGMRFFKTPPPYEDLKPLDVEYKAVAKHVRELRQRFFV